MITNAEFAKRAAYLAHVAASWAGDTLTMGKDRLGEPMREEAVERFLASIRERLDDIEKDALKAHTI